MSSKVLKPKRLLLNGIFGIIKERGDSVDDYKTWIRLTHYTESQMCSASKPWTSPSALVDIRPKYTEPFSTGVLCVGIGMWASRLTDLTKFWSHEWLVSAKLGVETQEYCMDSPIVKRMPFNHINEELLTETLKQFIGIKEQKSPPYLSEENLLISTKQWKPRTVSVVKTEPSPRIRECFSIEVLSFEGPDLKLRVISDGLFSCRQLVHDLGLKLNSCAILTDLSLNRMGIITATHCLKKYELHLNQMKEAIDKYSKLISKDLQQFENLKPQRKRYI